MCRTAEMFCVIVSVMLDLPSSSSSASTSHGILVSTCARIDVLKSVDPLQEVEARLS